MNFFSCLIFILTFVNTSADYHASAHEGWRKSRTKGGYTTYTRDEKNSKILGIKVEGILDAPIEAILANLRAIEGTESWTPSMKAKKTIKNISDLEAISYALNRMPWPMWDRELIMHNKLFLDRNKKLLYVISKSVHRDYPNYPKARKAIMADLGYSNFGMRPMPNGKTYVELTVFIDPKGKIPTWIINFYQKSWSVKYLKAIEKRSQRQQPTLLPGIKVLLDELRKII